MKSILLVAGTEPEKQARLRSFVAAYEKAGFKVSHFNYRKFYFNHSKTTNWLLNQELLRQVKKQNPDWLLVLKGESLQPGIIEKVKQHPRVKKLILESKTNNSAKIIIVGNFLSTEKINLFVEEIRKKYHFRIQFVEITEKQFQDMERIGIYDMNKKIIWRRKEGDS